MNYSKKDEDVEQAIVKVDRTAVFQEGMLLKGSTVDWFLRETYSSTL